MNKSLEDIVLFSVISYILFLLILLYILHCGLRHATVTKTCLG